MVVKTDYIYVKTWCADKDIREIIITSIGSMYITTDRGETFKYELKPLGKINKT